MSKARVVLITHPARGARAFARGLVRAGLAACVNLLSAGSVFRWRGRVQVEREALLVVKTTRARLAELELLVTSEHPYECPEFVVFTPEHVEARYQAWLESETRVRHAPRR